MATVSGLVVPIDVVAYCVGSIDAHERTGTFAGATTSYVSQVTEALPAFLGINVTRDFEQPPLWPLEQGIHLHWAAPDGLTHAATGGADLAFPPLPNRWLVTRIAIQGTQTASKSWILESDTLSTDPPNNNNHPTLPANDSNQNFRYLGVWEIFDGSWTEPEIPQSQTIKTLFGSEIHAVATGDIAFAALYPNARSVFGFYDDASDLPTQGSVTYVVTGWFSNPDNDPLSKQLTLADLQKQYSWTYADTDTLPTYSLYNGHVQAVEWNPATRYLSDTAPPVQVDVAVGNNPAETLAAYFRGLNHPSLPLFEQLFTAFEMGLLNQLKQPVAGQLALLTETMHEKGFASSDSGTMFTIVSARSANGKSAPTGDEVAPNLPLPLADALNLLNEYQQQCDLAEYEIEQYRWQLFADWYRMFQVDQTLQNEALNTVAARLNLWTAIQQNLTTAQNNVTQQTSVVTPMLGTSWLLKAIPAPRYWLPNEPVVLMAGPEIAAARRHGGDGRFHPDELLICRATTDLMTSVTVGSGSTVTIKATQFASVLPPTPNHLPYGAAAAALIGEACVLNTALASALSGIDEPDLVVGLNDWLNDTVEPSNPYQTYSGTLPSPVAVEWWAGENPWFPMVMLWELDFHPLLATTSGSQLQNYTADFFTANFALDPNNVGLLGYTPGTGGGSIAVDPQTIDFTPITSAQVYKGAAVLSPTSADNLEKLLFNYLPQNPDATLQKILGQLQETNILMQALTGMNSALLMRQQSLQLDIGVSTTAPLPFRTRTTQVKQVIPDMRMIPPLAPMYNGYFNPLRAGFAKLSLQIVDTFGEKRPVTINNLYLANTLSTYYEQKLEPGIIYLQPRLTQGARVLFRWLSADSAEYDEMNAHPATSPVCGWLLTNHLQRGLFLYNQMGKPLGSLTVKGDRSGVAWQSAPGDDGTVNQTVDVVMLHENPHLRDLAVQLNNASVAFFEAFWQTVDTAAGAVVPANPNAGASMSVLVGRPVALAQASLLLELQGITAYNQSWNTVVPGNAFIDTDNELNQVQFPAVLGDLAAQDDGLVGYFKEGNAGNYDFTTFYSEAAPVPAVPGVVKPAIDNVVLTPSSTPEGELPSITQGEEKLLLLLDPRAAVHLTTGILPTQSIEIPASQYADTLSGFEMTFLTTPVLEPLAGLTLPVPTEQGYTWSWIEEIRTGAGVSEWNVTPGIAAPAANAVWQYTSQRLTEGWLRLNPMVLRFNLVNAAGGAPVVQAGAANSLVLTVLNARHAPITFLPGTLNHEGTPAVGSVFYIHFGLLVDQAQVPSMQLSATGWSFAPLQDPQYGAYWAASPVAGHSVTLKPEETVTINIANVQVGTEGRTQAQVYFDYYGVQGVSDGVDVALLAITAKS